MTLPEALEFYDSQVTRLAREINELAEKKRELAQELNRIDGEAKCEGVELCYAWVGGENAGGPIVVAYKARELVK